MWDMKKEMGIVKSEQAKGQTLERRRRMTMTVLMFNSDLSPSLSSSQIFYFLGNLWIEILL